MKGMEEFMYKIICYHDDYLDVVEDTFQYLHGQDSRAYIKWKYYDNPYTEYPLSILALYNDKVVGFRGYMATKWQVENTELDILVACDTVVHPDHRMKGLSIAMGEKASDEYGSTYQAMLNFTSGLTSTPGYTRLGFVPLIEKKYMMIKQQQMKSSGVIECSSDNIPESIHGKKISIKKDSRFFGWRFNNPKAKYRFYHKNNDYIIVGSRDYKVRILDYSENDMNDIEDILKYIISHQENSSWISVITYSLSDRLSKVVNRLEFKTREKPKLWSVLVKITQNMHINMKDVSVWELREICSDLA